MTHVGMLQLHPGSQSAQILSHSPSVTRLLPVNEEWYHQQPIPCEERNILILLLSLNNIVLFSRHPYFINEEIMLYSDEICIHM